MKRLPFLSIIVPTYGRDRVLCDTIVSILETVDVRHELIVVDQSRTHDRETRAFLAQASESGKLLYIRERIPNLPRARNVGVGYSRGEIILFLDDDVTIPPGFFRRHLKRYEDGQIAGVTGRIVFPGEDPDAALGLPIPAREARKRLDLQIMRYRTPLRNPVHFVGANMSFRRCWIERAGGFSHRFDGSALGEDVEFAARLRRLGAELRYEPNAWLYHHAEQTGGCRIDDVPFRRSRGRMRNYYFAIFHGEGPLGGAHHAWRRWKPLRLNRDGANALATPRATFIQRASSALGRTVGALEGMGKAILFRNESGGLWELRGRRSTPRAQGVSRMPRSMSLVIPTYNREQDLVETLASVAACAPSDVEVVIIDQTPRKSRETMEAICALAASHRVIYKRRKSPNASAARNAGVRAASGEIILFIDDDTTVNRDLFRVHREAYSESCVVAVGGRIVWPGEDANASKPFPFARRAARHDVEAPVCYHDTAFPDVLHIITCNMSIRRDWFTMVGGFAERLPGGGEDLELVGRIRRADGRVAYEPRAKLIHRSSPAGGIRLALDRPFRFGYLRGRANHYATIRTVGFAGWLACCGRRLYAQGSRFLGGRSSRSGSGPVSELEQKRAGRIRAILYKFQQFAGSFCAVPVALGWLWLDRGKGGDYFRKIHSR